MVSKLVPNRIIDSESVRKPLDRHVGRYHSALSGILAALGRVLSAIRSPKGRWTISSPPTPLRRQPAGPYIRDSWDKLPVQAWRPTKIHNRIFKITPGLAKHRALVQQMSTGTRCSLRLKMVEEWFCPVGTLCLWHLCPKGFRTKCIKIIPQLF